MRQFVIILLCILAIVIGCATPSEQPKVLINAPAGTVEVRVEIADTSAERETGLMYRDSLPKDEGMLFIFDEEDVVGFWMKNTLIPLDIIFINSDWQIVNIHHSAQPCIADPYESYFSDEPVRYVLEVNAGYAEKHNISEGAPIRLIT